MRILLFLILVVPLEISAAPQKSKAQLAADAQRLAFMKAPTQADKEFDKQFQVPPASPYTEQKPQLKFSAKKVQSKSTASTSWALSNGSSDQTVTLGGAIEIEIMNLGAETAKVSVDIFFLSDSRNLCDWSRKPLKIASKEATTFRVSCAPVKRRDLNLNALDIHESTGKTLNSWIVHLKQENELIDIRASTKPLEVFGKDSAAMDKICARWKNEKQSEGWPEALLKTFE